MSSNIPLSLETILRLGTIAICIYEQVVFLLQVLFAPIANCRFRALATFVLFLQNTSSGEIKGLRFDSSKHVVLISASSGS